MQKEVLVVDDDPLYVDFVRDIFASPEIEVIATADGTQALSILETRIPKLIISDFEMPGMNGIALHDRLQEKETTKDIPFVFMTGSPNQPLSLYAEEQRVRVFSKENLINELIKLLDEVA